MSFSITNSQVAVAIRAAPDVDNVPPSIEIVLEYLISASKAIITKYAPAAPNDVQNMALIRLVGYLYDNDADNNVSRSSASTNSLQFSGAASLLSQWRVHRAGVIETEASIEPAQSGVLPPLPGEGNFILTNNNGLLTWVKFPEP